jgi:putative transposase
MGPPPGAIRKGRFSEEQIIRVLREHQAGIPVVALCRKHGISGAKFYTWRTKCGGMEVSDARKLKALEEENRKLKKLLARSGTAIRRKRPSKQDEVVAMLRRPEDATIVPVISSTSTYTVMHEQHGCPGVEIRWRGGVQYQRTIRENFFQSSLGQ